MSTSNLKKAQKAVNDAFANLGIALTSYSANDLEYLAHQIDVITDLEIDPADLQDPAELLHEEQVQNEREFLDDDDYSSNEYYEDRDHELENDGASEDF